MFRFTGNGFKLCPVNGGLPGALSQLHRTAVLISADDFIEGSTVTSVFRVLFYCTQCCGNVDQ